MATEMSSRERMLSALNCDKTDHVPMAFMIFTALNRRLNKARRGGDPTAVIEAQIELGVDVLIGPDPVQGKGTDLRRMGEQLRGRMCAWGGVNGSVTVEMGTKADIDAAVREAIEALGPEGLILSPVDNIRDPSDRTWQNVLALIGSWKKYRG